MKGAGFRQFKKLKKLAQNLKIRKDLQFFPGNVFGFFSSFVSVYDYCFICRPSDSTMLEDAGTESRTFATSAFAVRRSNYSAIDLIQ
jgi:hypothetical protein